MVATIDTLQIVKDLQTARFSDEPAEALARVMRTIQDAGARTA